MCSDCPVLCHHVTTLGSFIHHRTGTNRRVSSSGLEPSPLRLPGVWEGTLNYSSSLAPHLKNAVTGGKHLPRAFLEGTGTETYKVPNPAPATQEWLAMCKETERPEILGWGRGDKPTNHKCPVEDEHRATSLCFPTKFFSLSLFLFGSL